MKKIILTAAALFAAAIHAASPAGDWINIDDETGQQKAVVHITQLPNGELVGKIVKLLQKPGAKCEKCSGKQKGRPIEGMTILWGLLPDGENSWSGGRILDPSNGKVYKLKAELSENGKKLEVRGYIGVSLIGRTQTWIRKSN